MSDTKSVEEQYVKLSAHALEIIQALPVPASELAKSMSRQPPLAWQPSAEPASVIGAGLDVVAGMVRTHA